LRIVGAHNPTKIAVSRRPLKYRYSESKIESRVPPRWMPFEGFKTTSFVRTLSYFLHYTHSGKL